MIDVLTEDLIDLRAAGKLPPLRNHRTGKPAHVASVYRYVLQGARAVNGERIRLEVVRTPSGQVTSRQAVERFIAQLTDPDAAPATPTPRQRQREIEAAEARLCAAGI